MIGHHARLRDATGHSYPINACTRSNQERYSSVQVIFRAVPGSIVVTLKGYSRKNLTGIKNRAYGTTSYEICREITPFKRECPLSSSQSWHMMKNGSKIFIFFPDIAYGKHRNVV